MYIKFLVLFNNTNAVVILSFEWEKHIIVISNINRVPLECTVKLIYFQPTCWRFIKHTLVTRDYKLIRSLFFLDTKTHSNLKLFWVDETKKKNSRYFWVSDFAKLDRSIVANRILLLINICAKIVFSIFLIFNWKKK